MSKSKEEQERYEKFKRDILNSIEMMTPEEAISRLPDELPKDIRDELVKRSKTEKPLIFGMTLHNVLRNLNLTIKPKQR